MVLPALVRHDPDPPSLHSHKPRAAKVEAVKVCKTGMTRIEIESEKGPTLRIDDPGRFTAIKDNLLHSCVTEHSSHVA